MRKYNNKKSPYRQMTSRFTLSQLAIIDHLAGQPQTATLNEQATAIIRHNRGQSETRSILASNGKEITIIEMEN